MMSPEQIVDKQIAAYNERNADAFAAAYSDDVHVFLMPNLKLAIRGRQALRAHYASNVFTKEGLHAKVISRISVGNKVTDHELTHGLASQPVESIVVYEIVNDLIQVVWFYWPNAVFLPESKANE
jgi:hypothetical protein